MAPSEGPMFPNVTVRPEAKVTVICNLIMLYSLKKRRLLQDLLSLIGLVDQVAHNEVVAGAGLPNETR